MRWLSRALLIAALLSLCIGVPRPRQRHQVHRGPSWTTYGDRGSGRTIRTNSLHPVQLPSNLRQITSTSTAKSTFNFAPPSSVPNGLDLDAALAQVKSIMESTWTSDQTVNVLVSFALIGGKDVLANGGGVTFVRSTVLDELLPIGAAEAIDKENKNGDEADIEIIINQGATWYTGVDAAAIPATSYDFITVMLHEIYHHLIFSGRFFVDVILDPKAPGGVLQTARYTTGTEPTRFDRFAANAESCSVLGYLNASALETSTKKKPGELLADSMTNGKLFFAPSNSGGSIAKLHSPRIWIPKSSLYHLDPSVTTDPNDAIMHPQIPPGSAIRSIGVGVLNIQVAFLNSNVKGAKECDPALLVDPTPGTPPDPSDRTVPGSAHGVATDRENGAPPAPGAEAAGNVAEGPPTIGGLRRWAFALIVTFSIIGGLLLLGLCIFLILTCLKARKKGKGSTYDGYDDGYDHTTQETEDAEEVDVEQGAGGSEGSEARQSEGTIAESGNHGPDDSVMIDGTEGGPEGGPGGDDGLDGKGVPIVPGVKGKGRNGDGDGESGSWEDSGNGAGGKRSKKSSKKSPGGKGDSGDFTTSDQSRDGAGGMAGSVCPSTRGRKPCAPPRTFDPESVPSAPKSSQRNGSASKYSRKRSRSKSGKELPISDGILSRSSGYGSESTTSGSKSGVSKASASPGMQAGSVCPPTTAAPGRVKSSSRKASSHKASSVLAGSDDGGKGGGPFDCDTQTMEPFDCDATIFDCENVSRKTATKFRVSQKPIPKVVNPTTGDKSRLLYLDSETTDSTHLRPYERGSALKDPVGRKPKTAAKKQPTNLPPKVRPPPRLAPMSMVPTTTVPSESQYTEDAKIPSTKVPARKNTDTKTSHRSKHTRTTQPSSLYYSSDCSCSECINASEKKSTIVSCDYDSSISGSCCKHSSCKPSSSSVPTSCALTCTQDVPLKRSKSDKGSEKSCKKKSEGGKSSCKKSSSKKSIHSEGGKSSCKKSSSKKSIHSESGKSSCKKKSRSEDGKENAPANGKDSANCSRSRSKDSIHRSSKCKRSSSEKSIKSSKSKDCKSPPSTKPPLSCDPSSTDISSDYDFETKSELPKLKSTCPPTDKEEPNLKSTCPSSEKKTATRYHGSSKHHHRRRKEEVTTKVTTKQTLAKYEDGKLVNKKQKAKETTKKYRPVTEDSTSMYYDETSYATPTYTSSYFMSEDDDKTEKTDKRQRSHSHHSKSGKSHHRSDSRHKSRHDKSIRRSKSDKEIAGVRYHDDAESRHKSRREGLTRSTSGKDMRRSKSHHQLSSRYITQVQPPMMRERLTDIHSVALDPEVSRKYLEEKSRRESEKKSRRERSAHKSERERSRERERRDKSPYNERGTVVRKRKEVTTTKVRVGNESTTLGISEPTTTDFPTSWNTSDDLTLSRWSEDVTTSKTRRRERSRSRSRPRIQATAMKTASSAPPSSSANSSSVAKSSCPPSSSAESSSYVKSSCPPSSDSAHNSCSPSDVRVRVECNGKKPKVKYSKKNGIKVSVTVKD